MTKIIIFLCIFLLASGEQAVIVSDIIDNVYNKLDELIDSVIFTTQAIIEQFGIFITEITDDFTQLLDETVQSMHKDYQIIYDQMIFERTGKTLDEIIEHESSTSEWSFPVVCKLIAQTLRDDIVVAAADTYACLVKKVEEGKGHIENITNVANDILLELYLAKIEAKLCIENIDGVKSTVSSVLCLTKISAKVSWINVTKIPAVAKNFTKISWIVSTFFASQVYCSVANGFTGISKTSVERIERLESCIKQKAPDQ